MRVIAVLEVDEEKMAELEHILEDEMKLAVYPGIILKGYKEADKCSEYEYAAFVWNTKTKRYDQVQRPLITEALSRARYEEYVRKGWFNDYYDTSKVVFKKIVKDTDYSLTYKNNIEEGEASVIVQGIGNYRGEKTIHFTIYKNHLQPTDVMLENSSYLYDGQEKKPKVTLKYKGEVVPEDCYTVEYKNNVEEGAATVIVTPDETKGYADKQIVSFEIYKNDLAKANISLENSSVLYDGSEKKPVVNVVFEGNTLKENVDYVLVYENNILPGTANVKVEGIGQYKGIVELSYDIKPLSIETADVRLSNTIFTYDGSEKKPDVAAVTLEGKTLVAGTDYMVSYKDNINEGTAYVIITGIGIYSGVISQGFQILAYNAGMDSVYNEGDTLISNDYVYMITDDDAFEVELSGCTNKKLTKVAVPANVKDENGTNYKVTSIGNKAFYKNTKITSIEIGNNVKSIENYAFYGCKNVNSVKIGKSLEILGDSSFRKCTKLTSIVLPVKLTDLGQNAFYGCSKLKSITINAKSVVDVEDNAIKGISKKAIIKVSKNLVKKYKKEFNKKTGFKKTMSIKKK